VLTQYNEATGTPRYATPPAGYDPYTQAPPSAGPTSPGGAAWNGGEAASASGAPGGDWNVGGPVAELAENSAAQLREGFQEATEPLQEGIGRLGDQVRSAADDLGARTGQMLDELGLPPRRGSGAAGNAVGAGAMPPFSPQPASGANWNAGADPTAAAPPWNAGAGAAVAPGVGSGASAVTPVDTGIGGNWNGGDGSPEIAAPTLAEEYRNPGVGGLPGQGAGGNVASPLVTGTNNGGRGATVADPWDNASDPRFRTAAPGSGAGATATGGTAASGVTANGNLAGSGGLGGPTANPSFAGFTNTSTGAGVTGRLLVHQTGAWARRRWLAARPSIQRCSPCRTIARWKAWRMRLA
jgi:hypothetical protein